MEKIRIRNFRSIGSEEFDLTSNLIAFVGENNSGKSTVLNAIRVFNNREYEPSLNDIRHGSTYFDISIVKPMDDLYYKELYNNIVKREIYDVFINYFERNIKNRERQTKTYKQEFKRFIIDKFYGGINYQKIGLKLSVVKLDDGTLDIQRKFVSSQYKDIGTIVNANNDYLMCNFLYDIADIKDERNFNEEVEGNANSVTNSIFGFFINSIDESYKGTDKLHEKNTNELTISELNYLMSKKF